MPEIPVEEVMASLALVRSIQLLKHIHKYGFTGGEETLAGCSEPELYDIFDTLLNATQVVLAARRKLRDQS